MNALHRAHLVFTHAIIWEVSTTAILAELFVLRCTVQPADLLNNNMCYTVKLFNGCLEDKHVQQSWLLAMEYSFCKHCSLSD